jgi:L-lactate dehydrogenase complex protein LldG
MESRDFIVQRLRQTRATHRIAPDELGRPVYAAERIFADIPVAQPDAMVAQFTKKLTALRGEVYHVSNLQAAAERIAQMAKEAGLTLCGRQRTPLLDALFTESKELSFLESAMTLVGRDDTLPHESIERMQCAFTAADALVARTGSVVLRATTAGGRRLSVLPPMHCVVALRDQLVPSLSTWLSMSHIEKDWSYGTIITGPSRTADIERILVLGAHGPKRLVVIIVDPGQPNV